MNDTFTLDIRVYSPISIADPAYPEERMWGIEITNIFQPKKPLFVIDVERHCDCLEDVIKFGRQWLASRGLDYDATMNALLEKIVADEFRLDKTWVEKLEVRTPAWA